MREIQNQWWLNKAHEAQLAADTKNSKAFCNLINQFTSGILYLFQSPRTGLFSVKIRKKFLAITNFSGQ